MLKNRYSVPRERLEEAIKLIVENGKYANVLTQTSDQSYMVRIEGQPRPTEKQREGDSPHASDPITQDAPQSTQYNWSLTCFFVTPLGEEGSEQRKHADLILKHVVNPVAEEFGLQVVRADKIERSGLITQQIFGQLVRARLCIVDM